MSTLSSSGPPGEAPAAPASPSPGPTAATSSHPSGDDRFKVLDAGMKRHRYAPDALIEVLHQAQELFGHLRPDILTYVAHGLKLPPSRVYGVATFYHFFTFTPRGDHTCVVCLGTACYVKGGEAVMHAARQALRENPSMGAVSIETARCLGACSLAPVVVLDGEVVGNTSPEACRDRMKGWVPDGS